MEEKRRLNIITNSTRKLFASCPRAYKHRIIDEYSGTEFPRNLIYGSAVHKGLELFWKGKDEFGDAIMQIACVEAVKFAKEKGMDEFDIAEITALVTGYCV